MPSIQELLRALVGTGWAPDVQMAGVRPDYGLGGAMIQPAQRSPYDPTVQNASLEDVRGSLGELILAAGAGAVPGVGSRSMVRQAPARVRPGHEKEFGAWFKAQRKANAYDEKEPMPLYHGTTKDFTAFKAHEGAAAGEGIYLSKTPGLANAFAGDRPGSRVLKVYATGRFLRMPFNEAINAREWAARARAEGYDGLDTGLGEVLVFNPKNIKSATGNIGTYSRESEDIRE